MAVPRSLVGLVVWPFIQPWHVWAASTGKTIAIRCWGWPAHRVCLRGAYLGAQGGRVSARAAPGSASVAVLELPFWAIGRALGKSVLRGGLSGTGLGDSCGNELGRFVGARSPGGLWARRGWTEAGESANRPARHWGLRTGECIGR
jgi:hypothetical protein